MRIKQLNIIDFSGTHNRVIELDGGFNIVEGRNESGKTTVSSFIKFMFYGFADKAERGRLYSWGSNGACGTMVIENESGEYRIEREYFENGGEKVSVINLADGTEVEGSPDPAQMFLGVPLKVFTATAFVGQTSGNGEMKLGSAIENIIFSADESVNTEKALKALDEERVRLYYKNRKGGKIFDMLRERDEKRVRLERAKRANAELIEKEGTLRELKNKIAENNAKIAGVSDQIDYYEAAKKYRAILGYRQITEKIDSAKEELGEIERTESESGFVPDNEYIGELDALCKENEVLEAEEHTAHEKLDDHSLRSTEMHAVSAFIESIKGLGGEENVKRKLRTIDSRRSKSLAFGIIFLVIALIFGGAAALFRYTSRLDNLAENIKNAVSLSKSATVLCAAVAAIVFLAAAVVCFIIRSRQRISEAEILARLDVDSLYDLRENLSKMAFNETKLSIYKAERSELEARIESVNARRAELNRKIEALSEKTGCSNSFDAAESARAMMARKSELRADIDKYTLARDVLDVKADEGEENQLLQIIAGRPYGEEAFSNFETENAKRVYDFYTGANLSVTEKIRELEKEIAVLNATAEAPSVLADELICLDRDIEKDSKRLKALYLAHDRLMLASEDLRSSVSPRISGRASELMGELTDDRYNGIGVGSDLAMEYRGGDGFNHSIDYMSCGTKDVAYVSLRFALMELLYRGETPPMIFDESFSRLDDERLSAMLSLISRTASEGTQIILFTSQRRDAEESRRNSVRFNHINLR